MFGRGKRSGWNVVPRSVSALNDRDERFLVSEPRCSLIVESMGPHKGDVLVHGTTSAVHPRLGTDIRW